MDAGQLQQMLQSQYDNSTPVNDYISSASAGINNQTNKRVRDLMSRFSNTGMSRSGISGASLNDIYSNAGGQLSNVASQGEMMNMQNRSQILNQMLGLYKYQDQKPTWGDVAGGVAGSLLGSATGGFGTAIGGALGKLI